MYKISIIGAKNSGKTTLIQNLVSEFTQKNLNIISIKHTSHDHSFDNKEKDTYKHRAAGTSLTFAINPNEFAIFGRYDKPLLNQIEALIQGSTHLCLIEGDKFSDIPKILLSRNIENIDAAKIKNVIATFGEDITNLTDNHFQYHETDKLIKFLMFQMQGIPFAGEKL